MRWLSAIAIFAFLVVGTIKILPRTVYPTPHRDQPSARATVEKLQRVLPDSASISLQILEHGSRAAPQVALTFDADMTPAMRQLLDMGIVKSWYNAAIKETLDRERIPATVFLGGLWTKTYPQEAKDLANDPYIEIGNHSYNHYSFAAGCFNLPILSDDKDIDDVETAQKIITETTGVKPKLFRFPGGCEDRVSLQTVAKLGLTVVGWDVAANDGFNDDTESIVQQVERNVQNGSIIVFHIHDGPYAPKTNEALQKIINFLRLRGFAFVRVSEL